ncbi:GNAT family N-acetyltransferase [Lichenicoccus roseus]|uniref:N-acetyltransferase n=1 Tax=Lichenicoccus roseus TaxID=2683649 RepID=A0A5R9J844_9PROT|nr:GNAT family N-acetyltransferase [Lichenicoccus roseus]TLU73139.1 N-acetyltransferase [Lichenicoccus roseus]
MPDQSLSLSLHPAIKSIEPEKWDRCAGTDNPFVSHAFLSAVEDSGSAGSRTGWLPRHAVLSQGAEILAVAPMYAKSHSYGEYVFDHGWAAAFERAGGQYYPKLQVASPFSPVPGPRLLISPTVPADRQGAIMQAMAEALSQACTELSLSSVHVTFCRPEEYESLGEAGWLQRLGTQFHWENAGYASFDDFLAGFNSRKRKVVRRERRDANSCGLVFRTLRGSEITKAHWKAFYRFYTSTVDRKWGSAYLTERFFPLLSERLGDRVVLMLAEHEGQPVAGALNLLGRDALYGRNWGCLGDWPFLHFELCYYRAIDFAIEHGLARVEAGAQGEHKIQRGYLPKPTYSAHWIAHPGLRRAVASFVDEEREARLQEMEALAEYSPYRQEAPE